MTIDDGGHRQYYLAYDKAPQDTFVATPGAEGTQSPPELLELEEGSRSATYGSVPLDVATWT